MRALVQAMDWSKTALGPQESWPQALKLATEIMLCSGFPMALRWGPEFIFLYNDAYLSILGDKHPWALGLPTAVAWQEAWTTIEPFHSAILKGESGPIFREDMLLRIKRQGVDTFEDGRFTLAYSPVPDPMASNGIGGVMVIVVETTRRVETERQLRAAEEALRHLNATLEQQVAERTRDHDRLWRNSQDLLLVLDKGGTFKAANPAWTRILGWEPEEVVGRSHLHFQHPEDHASSKVALARASAGDMPTREVRLRHKDGSYRWIAWLAAPEENFIYASGRDITEEKKAATDLADAQEALRQAQKMEAIGQLTGGIAHDFNNILMVIMANVDALEEEKTLDPDLRDPIKGIGRAAERAAGLTRQLLAFSRKQVLQPQRTNINDLVTVTGQLLRRTLGEHIEIDSMLADDLGSVDVDRAQLEAALVNLCINARDAMPAGGRLLIETKNTALDAEYAAHHPDATAGEYVLISVTDTGTGIPPEVLGHVFEPFFTTKDVGKGTGLGLSMVYGFIKQSKGHINLYSEVGRGTSVKLYLPRNQSAAEEPRVRPAPALPSGNRRILVVEDDPQVRASVTRQIRSLGHTVSEAASAAAGIAAFEAAAEPYELMLTDVIMPGPMNGSALAEEIARRWPTTKIVFMSGHPENATFHQGLLGAGAVLLSKPFRKSDLARILRRTLDGEESDD
jgi:PAS domain S-box-containing protein